MDSPSQLWALLLVPDQGRSGRGQSTIAGLADVTPTWPGKAMGNVEKLLKNGWKMRMFSEELEL